MAWRYPFKNWTPIKIKWPDKHLHTKGSKTLKIITIINGAIQNATIKYCKNSLKNILICYKNYKIKCGNTLKLQTLIIRE